MNMQIESGWTKKKEEVNLIGSGVRLANVE